MTTQSTVIVAPLSPSHIVIFAMLAQHGPLANESVIRKWNRLTAPKFSSHHRLIPSCPRCPSPEGSIIEGPTGSCTTASGANSASHSSLRPAATAAMERRETRRAGWSPSGASQVMLSVTHKTVTCSSKASRLPADRSRDLQPGRRGAVLPPPLHVRQARWHELEPVEEAQDSVPGTEIGFHRRPRRHRPQSGHGLGVAVAGELGEGQVAARAHTVPEPGHDAP